MDLLYSLLLLGAIMKQILIFAHEPSWSKSQGPYYYADLDSLAISKWKKNTAHNHYTHGFPTPFPQADWWAAGNLEPHVEIYFYRRFSHVIRL